MRLEEKFQLCYIKIEDFFSWIEENNLFNKDFSEVKKKWEKKTIQEPNFFSDTELLIIYEDVIVLKCHDENHSSFLAKTYELDYQIICQQLFQEKKKIIIISDIQWRERKIGEKLIILFKDEETIEKNLKEGLKEK